MSTHSDTHSDTHGDPHSDTHSDTHGDPHGDCIPDLLVVGGGITGAAVARDAAGRGYRVVVCERADLGSGTTSRSSRLAHGGLRYLEHYAFAMVKEALRERERLFAAAPARARAVRFRLPLASSPRAPWMVEAGLRVYDALAGERTSRREEGAFTYKDGVCDPELITADLAADAVTRGATIRTYTTVTSWEGGAAVTSAGDRIHPRATILAAGPWTDRVLCGWGMELPSPVLAATRGTHLFLDAPIAEPHLLQATSDGRVFFAVPWLGGTLIGTTDLDETGDPALVRPRIEEIEYLRAAVARHLPSLADAPLRGVWTGVRPLVQSGRTAGERSRSEVVMRHPRRKSLVLVAGGKLTTMRLMAERAVNLVERAILDRPPRPWTAGVPLATAPEAFAVQRLSDLLLRRSYAAFDADRSAARRVAEEHARREGWDEARLEKEWASFLKEAGGDFGLEFPG